MSEQKKRIIAFVVTFLMVFSLFPVGVLAYEQETEPELLVYVQQPEISDYIQPHTVGVFSFDIFNNGEGGSPSRPNASLAAAGIIRMWAQLDGVNTPVYFAAAETIIALDQNGNCAREFVRVNRVWQDGTGWSDYFALVDVDKDGPWQRINLSITVHGQTVEVLLVNANRIHPPASVVSYQIVVEGFDWGPGVTRLILALDDVVDPSDVDSADLVASFYREPGFRFLYAATFTPEMQTANITNAFVSDVNGIQIAEPGNFVTLELKVHPSTGVNPFTFTLIPMGNNWANPFVTNISWMDTSFVPERTGKIQPIADLFTRDRQFVYGNITLQYGYYVPAEAAESDRPVIIWLHGGGEGSRNLSAGTDAALLGNRVTQLAAPEIQYIMGGAHVFVPQAPTMWLAGTSNASATGYVSYFEDALLALIDHYLDNTPGVDRSRIYVGGCSNGGYMTIRLLMRRPDLFAASFPICILYQPHWLSDEKVDSIAHIPMWMVHDIADPTTPHAHSLNVLERLIAAGADDIHLTTTDGLFSDEFFRPDGSPWEFDRHWSWIPALNNTVTGLINGVEMSLFEWMALQRLAAPGPVLTFDIFNNGPGGSPSRPNPGLAAAGTIRMWTQLDGVNAPVYFTASETIVALDQNGNCAREFITVPQMWQAGIGWLPYFNRIDVDKNRQWRYINFSITASGQTVELLLINANYVPSADYHTVTFVVEPGAVAVYLAPGAVTTVEVPHGEEIPAGDIPNIEIRTGFYFAGWYPGNPAEHGNVYTDLIFVARINPLFHYVTFEAEEGGVDIPLTPWRNPVRVRDGMPVSVASIPSPEALPGFVFVGWYHGEEAVNPATYIIRDNITITAVFEPLEVAGDLVAIFLPELSDWITVEENGSWIWVGRYVDFAVTAPGLPAGEHEITSISFEHVGAGYLPTVRGVGGNPTHHIPGGPDVRFTPVSFTVDGNGVGTMRLYLHSSSVPRPLHTWDLELTVTVAGPNGPIVSEPIETILTDPGLWTLYWEDQFEGDTLNYDYWHVQIGRGALYGLTNWGNNELQFYRRENIAVRDGNLVITAMHHSTPQGGGAPGPASVWTSGRLRTTGNVGVTTLYGRIEARISLPIANGLWPAFWMMPQETVAGEATIYGGWAASGEIDIMEARGRQPDRTNGAIHFGGNWPNNVFTAGYYHFPVMEPAHTIRDFNTFAIEWEPGEIRWYVNDTMYMRQNRWHTRGAGQQADFTYPAPFDQEFHILLNMAMGGVFDPGATLNPADFADGGLNKYVQYVRIWHQNESVRPMRYPIHPDDLAMVPDPIPPEAKQPVGDGGLIWDTNFSNVHLRTGPPTGTVYNPDMPGNSRFPFIDGWVVGSFAGGGNVSGYQLHNVDGSTFIEVQIASAGVRYGNQLMQRVPLVYGRHYRLTFDAYAAADRNIEVGIAQGGDPGWTNYTTTGAIGLTTTPQTFTHYFTMAHPTHVNARLEMNLGLSSINVFIGNVSLVEVAYVPIPEDTTLKFPILSSGTLIWNGTFDQGRERLAFWGREIVPGSGTISVNPALPRQLEVRNISGTSSPADVILRQNRIPFFNDTYRIAFDAFASAARDIQFRIVSMATGNVFYTGTVSIGSTMQRHTVDFTPSGIFSGAAGYEMQFQFLFGGFGADVTMDNVTLTRQTFTDINLGDVTIFPLRNGDFFNGTVGWGLLSIYGGAGSLTAADGVANVNITSVGTVPWSQIFDTQQFPVHAGFVYNITFDVRGVERDIEVVPYSGGSRVFAPPNYQIVRVTDEWTTHTFSWAETADGMASLRFFLGVTVGDLNVPGTVQFRNVNVYIAAGAQFYEQIPTFIPATTNNTVGNAITLIYNAVLDPAHSTANPAFSAATRTVRVNGNVVAHTTPADGEIVIPASAFPVAGTYVITISAPGFESVSFNQFIGEGIGGPVLDGGLVNNGNFAVPPFQPGHFGPYAWVGQPGEWELYLQSISAILAFPTGQGMSLHFPGGSSQILPPAGIGMWHVQLRQSNNNRVTAGGEYRFIFEARSSVDRNVWVGLIGNADAAATRSVIPLTQEWTRYERIFTGPLMPATGANARSVQIFMGANGADPWHGIPHTVDIRLVRIEPVTSEPGPYEVYNSNFLLPIGTAPGTGNAWGWVGNNGWYMMRANNAGIASANTGPDGLAMAITPGTNNWYAQLSTQNRPAPGSAASGQVIELTPGGSYVVTIQARASVPRPVLAAITAGGVNRHMLELTDSWQTFTIPVTGPLFNNRITFYLGGAGGYTADGFYPVVPVPTAAHTVYFREVSIRRA